MLEEHNAADSPLLSGTQRRRRKHPQAETTMQLQEEKEDIERGN
jgi:hypothetical protein